MKRTPKTYLYKSACGSYVKIGVSSQPFVRIRAITIPSSGAVIPKRLISKPCRMVRVVPGTRDEEQALHEALSAYHREGEWFSKQCQADPAYRAIFLEREPQLTSAFPSTKPIVLPPEVHRQVKMSAALDRITLSEFISVALTEAAKDAFRRHDMGELRPA